MDCIVTIIHYSQSNSTIIIFSSKLYNIIIWHLLKSILIC
jgi:hypothetical protein